MLQQPKPIQTTKALIEILKSKTIKAVTVIDDVTIQDQLKIQRAITQQRSKGVVSVIVIATRKENR
jgi:hypothetical protein